MLWILRMLRRRFIGIDRHKSRFKEKKRERLLVSVRRARGIHFLLGNIFLIFFADAAQLVFYL